MHRVVMFSGGLASWAEAKLVVQRHGMWNVDLLFSDTGNEDVDLYRFLYEAAANVGAPLTIVRNPGAANIFELARKKRSLPSNLAPFCSVQMKVLPAQEWVRALGKPVVVHLGLYQDEVHRLESARKRWEGIAEVESYLSQMPLVHNDLKAMAKSNKLRLPRLYDLGFPHNNCGGGCVRAGKSQWLLLYQTNPELYDQWEKLEEEISALHGRPHTILKGISLKELRRGKTANASDSPGCGCFVEE